MGFRPNAWATVWSVEPSTTGASTKVRISTSKKNKQGEYEQDFSKFCLFIGDAHKKASKLKEKSRIKLTSIEYTNTYDKVKEKEYETWKVFDFDFSDEKAENSTPGEAFEMSAFDQPDTSEDKLPF